MLAINSLRNNSENKEFKEQENNFRRDSKVTFGANLKLKFE